MSANAVTIVQEGKLVNTEVSQLRLGDLVVAQAGDVVPADLQLVEARGLEVDEFEITGEIMPVLKKVGAADAVLYMGSRVVRGAAKGTVVALGEHTEYGKVLREDWEDEKPAKFPLFKTRYLGLILALLPAVLIAIVRTHQVVGAVGLYGLAALALIVLQNDALFRSYLTNAELKTLQRRGIRIRSISALAKLRDVDLMCFDKTGVLTTRRMAVKTLYFADRVAQGDDPLADKANADIAALVKLGCALGNDVLFYEKLDLATPVDKALLAYATHNGVDVQATLARYQRIYDEPFDSEKRFMASGFARDGQALYFLKGDPDVVLRKCRSYVTTDGAQHPLDWEFRRLQDGYLDAVSQQRDTAIALAYRTESPDLPPTGYTFLCLFQLENPLQPDARDIVSALAARGIRSMMLTGDRAATAIKISAACGITAGSQACLTGRVLERMGAVEIARQSDYCSVFAQLMPSQKGFLIRFLQRDGHRVAMIGDGPNDGIALRAADVGISYLNDSSPIARRLAKILIHELADLSLLIESAFRIERRAKQWKLCRMAAIAAIVLGLAGWVLSWLR